MLPQFPHFKPLELTDKADIEAITTQYPPYSDFNFVSLFSWNIEDKARVSELNGNFILKFNDYIIQDPFFTFLGTNDISITIKTLLNQAKKDNIQKKLKLIPEVVISSLQKENQFIVQEDPDSFDYILSIPEMCEFEGSKYHKHRKHLHKFQQQYSNCKATILDLTDIMIQKQILSLFKQWQQDKQQSDIETANEFKAIQRLLINAIALNVFSIGIYNEDKIVAFIILDHNYNDYTTSHFVKYDRSYENITYFLRQQSSYELKRQGFLYLNIEQDLGIPTLRQAKLKWRPIEFLKKFTITLPE